MRIVAKDGVDADEYCLVFAAQCARVCSRALIRYPARIAGVSGDLSVQARGKFYRNERTAIAVKKEKTFVERFGLGGTSTDRNLDIRAAQMPDARAGNLRIRVAHATNDPLYFCPYDRIDARRRLAPMAAWLEVEVKRCVARLPGGGLKRIDLGMRRSDLVMIPTAYDAAIFHDDRSYHRIRERLAARFFCKRKRIFQVTDVASIHLLHGARPL